MTDEESKVSGETRREEAPDLILAAIIKRILVIIILIKKFGLIFTDFDLAPKQNEKIGYCELDLAVVPYVVVPKEEHGRGFKNFEPLTLQSDGCKRYH